ncbi:hypothetical protein [uncultured Clostridium sp.]|uniref:hypothetical protein n=1 Tax=uncultured Clostridium sp. TaxID=59620 RepID=UPI0026ECCA4A|nr:hypothetical protein [uncultured Clostridium sp.]
MKAMISQPMKGKTNEEIVAERQDLVEILEEQGYEVLDTVFDEKDVLRNTPLCYLAKSLEALDEADVLVCMKGWEDAPRLCFRTPSSRNI